MLLTIKTAVAQEPLLINLLGSFSAYFKNYYSASANPNLRASFGFFGKFGFLITFKHELLTKVELRINVNYLLKNLGKKFLHDHRKQQRKNIKAMALFLCSV